MNNRRTFRWNCKMDGCFREKKCPDLTVFDDCFPNKNSLGDVDGINETNGKGLLLEWKTSSANIPTGQRIMYQKLTKTGILSVLVVLGNAETMETKEYCWFYKGKQSEWKTADLEKIKAQIKSWVNWTKELPL